MSILLWTIGLYLLTLPYTSWALYLAVMNLERQEDEKTLTSVSKAWSWPLVIVALIQDLILTWTWGTLLFLDPPRWGEWTFTKRLQRYHVTGGWRDKFATWFCTQLLNGGDNSGKHC